MSQLAVFGASGRTGALLVDLARSRGLGIRALVRPATPFDDRPGVTVVRGSLEVAEHVAATLSGTVAACCLYGPRETTKPPFCASATSKVIHAMKDLSLRRLVCLTGAMVGALPDNVSLPMRAMAALYRRQVPALATDAAEQERIVMESALDWTLAKPPRLTDEPPSGRMRASPTLRVGLMSRLGRGDLAAFLLDEIIRARHVRERVYVSY